MEEIQAVLFDFDGVVADTLPDIAAAVNATLRHFGRKTLEQEKIACFVGNGAKKLLERAFSAAPLADETKAVAETSSNTVSDDIFEWYKSYYHEHCKEKTQLYPSFQGLLELLEICGIHMATVTNKPLSITNTLIEKLGIQGFFNAVICPELVQNMKPHPEGLLLALKKINDQRTATGKPVILPENVLMVGDSATDIQAGKAAGMKTCAITGGYGNTGLLLAEEPDMTLVIASELIPFFC